MCYWKMQAWNNTGLQYVSKTSKYNMNQAILYFTHNTENVHTEWTIKIFLEFFYILYLWKQSSSNIPGFINTQDTHKHYWWYVSSITIQHCALFYWVTFMMVFMNWLETDFQIYLNN